MKMKFDSRVVAAKVATAYANKLGDHQYLTFVEILEECLRRAYDAGYHNALYAVRYEESKS